MVYVLAADRALLATMKANGAPPLSKLQKPCWAFLYRICSLEGHKDRVRQLFTEVVVALGVWKHWS